MHKETREDKEIHSTQQLREKNKRLAEMSNEEFASDFDSNIDEQAKKELEKMQQKEKNGEQ